MPRFSIDLTKREWEKLLLDAERQHRPPRDHAAFLVARGLGLAKREDPLPEPESDGQVAFAAA
jgi:hypothetical protein